MLSLVTVLVAAAAVSGSVVQHRPERRVADADFLNREKRILELYIGIGHNQHLGDKYSTYDFNANLGSFTDEKYPKEFLQAYNRGMLPQNGIFNLFCHRTRHDMIKLFDLFYFAKDFETFIQVAGWARMHVNPEMFAKAFTLAVIHRDDTQSIVLPPLYEVIPNMFTPEDTLHKVFDAKMSGIKEGQFTYNNTGYEYNYHRAMFGNILSPDNRGYGDFRISYFREDVGLNNYLANFFLRNPVWMSSEKYNSPWIKRRGENFYQTLQQLLARYTQERTAHGLPNVEILQWNQPIRVGYNPRLAHLNGQSLYLRPDNLIPELHNPHAVIRTQKLERRVRDIIDIGAYWNESKRAMMRFDNEDGVEILGRMIYGTTDRPNKNYIQSAFFSGLEALAYITSTASDRSYIGNALGCGLTMARDPVFYNYLARLVKAFQDFKRTLHPYSHDDVVFNGVKVQNVEVDKLITYFDMFDYEVTSSVSMAQSSDYKDHRYIARQYRLNHKPYNYNITVNSAQAVDGIIRVFLGHKYDVDYHLLTLEQARMTFVEIDRFQVKLAAGVNVLERNSKESPIFTSDGEGFRTLYGNTLNQNTPSYISEYGHCGLPERLQLPMGWRGGRPAQLAVVVNSYDRKAANPGNNKFDIACGGDALNDGRPMGFPFDRPIHLCTFHVPNIFYRDVNIYHREQTEVNRPVAS